MPDNLVTATLDYLTRKTNEETYLQSPPDREPRRPPAAHRDHRETTTRRRLTTVQPDSKGPALAQGPVPCTFTGRAAGGESSSRRRGCCSAPPTSTTISSSPGLTAGRCTPSSSQWRSSSAKITWEALDQGTVGALREHRRRMLEERLLVGADFDDLGLVFHQPDGTWLRPDAVSAAFLRRAHRYGLPRLTLHGLRHMGDPGPRARRPPPGRPGTPRPLDDRHHPRDLQPRIANPPRRGGPAGRRPGDAEGRLSARGRVGSRAVTTGGTGAPGSG